MISTRAWSLHCAVTDRTSECVIELAPRRDGGSCGGVFRVEQYLGDSLTWEFELASLPTSFYFDYALAPGALIVAISTNEPVELGSGTLGPQTAGENSDFVIAKFSR